LHESALTDILERHQMVALVIAIVLLLLFITICYLFIYFLDDFLEECLTADFWVCFIYDLYFVLCVSMELSVVWGLCFGLFAILRLAIM
jgi:hypothetical protein